MSAVLRPEPDGPPMGRLALLALAVLGLHLALLSGWPGPSSTDDLASFGQVQVPDLAQANRQPTADTAPSPPAPAERSSVRWLLVPPPAPPSPPAPPGPPAPPVVPPTPAQPPPLTPAQAPPPGTEALASAGEPDAQAGVSPVGPIEPVEDETQLGAAAEAPEAPAVEDIAPTTQPPPETEQPLAPTDPVQKAQAEAPVASAPSAQDATPGPAAAPAAIPAFRTRGLPPATAPGSARLEYDVFGQAKGMNYQASGVLEWDHDNLNYQAQMRVSAFMLGSRTQRSTGRLDATGLHPDRFLDISRREQETRFDSERERIAYRGHEHQDPLHAGAQDRLSVILQLAARFNATMPVAGQRLHLQVAGASGTEHWEFEVVGRESISVPAGGFSAWHVRRVARQSGDAATSVWLAPSQDHLPVRLVISQPSGDRLEQVLRRLP